MSETTETTRIAVLISGSGTNLQAIIDRTRDGYVPNAEVVVVVSNRRDAYGLERARQADAEQRDTDQEEHGATSDAGCAKIPPGEKYPLVILDSSCM